MPHRKHEVEKHTPVRPPVTMTARAKFKVGDRVTVKDHELSGEVIEVPELDADFLAKKEQFYSVRLDPWTAEEFLDANGNPQLRYRHPADAEGKKARYRAHESDSLGCVPESALTPE